MKNNVDKILHSISTQKNSEHDHKVQAFQSMTMRSKSWEVVVYTFDLGTHEAEAVGSLSSKPA